MAQKRKRTDLSLADKYEAVKLLEQKLSQTEIAKRMGCSQPQICHISKNRESIKADYEASENPQRKRQRAGKAPSVEGALKDWFTMARSKDIPLSTTILQEKATSLATTMHIEDFNPTAGWLYRWKQRNNVGYKKLHGEKKDADSQAAEHRTTIVLPELLQEYTADNVYNADEMGIYYRALPDGTLNFRSEKTKDRVTALVCVNMTGTDKRKLLVIGKSRDPRCFCGKKSLPVTYKSSKNAWMTGDIFHEWLKEFNRDMVRQKRKVLLLVDNCSAHPKEAAEHLSNIRMEFLPENTTSMIQPCDMGIIRNLKVLYRTGVVRKLVEDIDNVATAMDLARKLTILDAVHLLSKAWKNVKMTTIVNCYRKAGFLPEEVEAEEEIVVPDGMTREEFCEYIDHDKDLECHRVPSNEDLCAKFIKDESSDIEERSEEETETGSGDLDDEPPTSVNGANKCMEYMRRFLEEHGCDDFSDYYGLQEKCEIIALKKKRQSMITEFID